MWIFVALTNARPLDAKERRRRRWRVAGACFLVLAGVSFVSGFFFAGPIIAQSEIPTNYYAVQKGDRFFAVKRRGGENPPAFEIAENQYRLWKQGEGIHALFHGGACFCFLVAWVILAATQRHAAAPPG
jgi:hypothetical protein